MRAGAARRERLRRVGRLFAYSTVVQTLAWLIVIASGGWTLFGYASFIVLAASSMLTGVVLLVFTEEP